MSSNIFACFGYVIEVTIDLISALNITKQSIKEQFGTEHFQADEWEEMDVLSILREFSYERQNIDITINGEVVSPILFYFDADSEYADDMECGTYLEFDKELLYTFNPTTIKTALDSKNLTPELKSWTACG